METVFENKNGAIFLPYLWSKAVFPNIFLMHSPLARFQNLYFLPLQNKTKTLGFLFSCDAFLHYSNPTYLSAASDCNSLFETTIVQTPQQSLLQGITL